MTAEPWPNRPWLIERPTRGALDLMADRPSLDLPGELAHLRDRLRGNCLAEAGQAAARVDRHAAAQGRGTVA